MEEAKRVLIVGSSPGARTCERIIKRSFEARLRTPEALGESEIEWCSFILTLSKDLRRVIARTYPDAYLTRRVISLNIPEDRAEDRGALTRMIEAQLEYHGLYVR